MRKLLIIISAIVLMLCSCTKEQETTYTFTTEGSIIGQIVGLFKGSGYSNATCNVIIFEYYGEQRVASQTIKEVEDGKEYTFVATPKTEFITVRIDIKVGGHKTRPDDTITDYIANVFYLSDGEDTKVILSEDTLTSDYEPK